MLEMTLATDFIPGSNLKGKEAGANWLFLLPNINLRRVVCLGAPLPSTLEMLSNLSQELILATPKSRGLPDSEQRVDLEGVEQVAFTRDGMLPLQDGCANLILLTGPDNMRQFNENKEYRSELKRLLIADGFVYGEKRGYLMSRPGFAEMEKADTIAGSLYSFWLTPLNGEMQTAVPLDDPSTIAYFLQNKLYSPMFNLTALMSKRVKRFAPGRAQNVNSLSITSAGAGVKSNLRFPSLNQLISKTGLGFLRALQRVEELVDRSCSVRRYGIFYGGPQGESGARPPRYLRSIAQDAGIYLDNYRWGLSARGEYSSRKMLFYLFDRDHESVEGQPNYIVKMVRDPSFNYRLENEAQSLQLLAEKGLHEPDILPRMVFYGHHAGLALVGESIIEGIPFRQKTEATADCPYGRAALRWFVDLGAATADIKAAAPDDIAASLTKLLARFVEIYHPTFEQHDFLAQQIAKLSHSESAVPLVFQHGDPGPWNMLVTPGGRVAVLDWEAAEPAGMPVWDLLYFMRSYSLDAARKQGVNNRLTAFTQQFLNNTPLSRLFVKTIAGYCQRISLDGRLVEPHFYTCWMHRSLKESMRLEPANLGQGHFANLIWWCRKHRDSVTLSRLFSLAAEPSGRVELAGDFSESNDLLRK